MLSPRHNTHGQFIRAGRHGPRLPPDLGRSIRLGRVWHRGISPGGERQQGARRELREAVRSSPPEVIARASDFARKGQAILIETISAGKPLMEEAISARLDLMRTELAGESPSALELLLVERIASPTCDCARSHRC